MPARCAELAAPLPAGTPRNAFIAASALGALIAFTVCFRGRASTAGDSPVTALRRSFVLSDASTADDRLRQWRVLTAG
jgi:hypothetical protein